MTRRYYVPDLPLGGGPVDLPDTEAQHAARVMRAAVGDPLTLFDGRGNEAVAVIEAIAKRRCTVVSDPAVAISRELERPLQLGIALPKPDRAKEMVERLTELGVARITPLVCERTQRPPTASLIEKLYRVVIEASKQCERNVLMRIDDPIRFDEYSEFDFHGQRLIAHPDGVSIAELTTSVDDANGWSALIGPEGGFTDGEVAAAVDRGFAKVGLGKRIYRVETAACAIATFLGT